MYYIFWNGKFGVFLAALVAWYIFISYYIRYDVTHGSPLSNAFYTLTEMEEKQEFEKNEIFKKYECSSVFKHMDHMDIHDTSVNPITLLHAMYHHQNDGEAHVERKYFNTTRIFQCLHMKLKFIKNHKRPYGQISTIAISVITPITGYILTVMVSIAYTQFKESIQIYREILGSLMTIVIIISGLKDLDFDEKHRKDGNSFSYQMDMIFSKIIAFPEILLKHMTKESKETISRTLGIEHKSFVDKGNTRFNALKNDFPSTDDTINLLHFGQRDIFSIESQVTSMLVDIHNTERSVSSETHKPEFLIRELGCVREKLRRLFELSFGLQSLYQTRLPENLHRIITIGGMGVYILMIPAFWSIYGWIFGTIVIMVCAICFIAVLEGIDRMNPIFDIRNPIYHEIITENQMTIVRMKNIYHSSIAYGDGGGDMIFPTKQSISREQEHHKFY